MWPLGGGLAGCRRAGTAGGFLGAPPRPCFHASSATRIAKSAPRWSLIFRRLSMSAWDPA
jgi:hypothetical protein